MLEIWKCLMMFGLTVVLVFQLEIYTGGAEKYNAWYSAYCCSLTSLGTPELEINRTFTEMQDMKS